MLYGPYKDFDRFLTDLALTIENKYVSRKDIKVTVNNDRTEDKPIDTLLTINIEGNDDELIIKYDMTDIDEEPGGSSTLDISCSFGDMSCSMGVTRDNESDYAEAAMSNESDIKFAVLKFIEDEINK